MARNSATFAKRQREAERQRKRRDKERRKHDRRGTGREPVADGDEDPDLAGIAVGPQPHPYLDDDELKEIRAEIRASEE